MPQYPSTDESSADVGFGIRASVTRHQVRMGDQVVGYRVEVAESPVCGPQGLLSGTALTIAYLRSDVSDLDKRPVVFCYDACPGASSAALHFRAMAQVIGAPTSIEYGDHAMASRLVNIPLDAADLVFIDPVLTGFSRVRRGDEIGWFCNSKFDAITLARVIDNWLFDHERLRSPRYLVGSWEGAPLLLHFAPDLSFDGVLLLAEDGWRGLADRSVGTSGEALGQQTPSVWRRIFDRLTGAVASQGRARMAASFAASARQTSLVGRYLVEQLRFPASGVYWEASPSRRSSWRWEPAPDASRIMRDAMRRNPNLQFFELRFGALSYSEGELALSRGGRAPVLLSGPAWEGEPQAFNSAIRRFVRRP